jgi:hypothetical protein
VAGANCVNQRPPEGRGERQPLIDLIKSISMLLASARCMTLGSISLCTRLRNDSPGPMRLMTKPSNFRRAFLGAYRIFFPVAATVKSSSFLADLNAQASHEGVYRTRLRPPSCYDRSSLSPRTRRSTSCEFSFATVGRIPLRDGARGPRYILRNTLYLWSEQRLAPYLRA